MSDLFNEKTHTTLTQLCHLDNTAGKYWLPGRQWCRAPLRLFPLCLPGKVLPFPQQSAFTSRCRGFSLGLKTSLLCRARKGHAGFKIVAFHIFVTCLICHVPSRIIGLSSEACLSWLIWVILLQEMTNGVKTVLKSKTTISVNWYSKFFGGRSQNANGLVRFQLC